MFFRRGWFLNKPLAITVKWLRLVGQHLLALLVASFAWAKSMHVIQSVLPTHNARASFCRSSLSRSVRSIHSEIYTTTLDLHRYGRVRDLLYARTTFCCIAHETYQSWVCVYSGCSTTCTAQCDRSLPEGAFFPGDDKHRLDSLRLQYAIYVSSFWANRLVSMRNNN